jgi:uncharacterized protein YdhG (YjbR/CyaY superfamily)
MNKLMKPVKFKSTDDYIASFPKSTQALLQQVRKAILTAAPGAEETISYNMPAYKLNGPLVYFAGYDNHIGLYALPSGNTEFKKELASYKQGKGSIQFPVDKPLPLGLISKIVKFRVKENRQK